LRNIIYCDQDFFKYFINSCKGKDLFELSEKNESYLIDLHNLFFSCLSNIYINLSENEIITSNNPYVKKLIKDQAIKPSFIFEYIEGPNNIENLNPHSIFLLGIDKFKASKIQEQLGMLVISKEEISKVKSLFYDKTYFFNKKNPLKDYDFFFKHLVPCNSLVITDDYLFNGNGDEDLEVSIDKNLIPIFKTILPEKCLVDFHLTIISAPSGQNHNNIIFKLKERLKDYNYSIKVNFIIKNYHGRYIFTNYIQIRSTEYGFNNIAKDKITGSLKWKYRKNGFNFKSIFSPKDGSEYFGNKQDCSICYEAGTTVGDHFKNRLIN
jgi:hypothetical protein